MVPLVRWFLLVEAIAFGLAALVHSGVLVEGYEHAKAATAESVIGLVLLAGLAASLAAPRFSRAVGLWAQAFALLGTCVGIVTMFVGIGPQSSFDAALHAGFVLLLVAGLLFVARGRAGAPAQRA